MTGQLHVLSSQNCPLSWGGLDLSQHMVPYAHLSPHPEWQLDWFSHFCRAHDCDRLRDHTTQPAIICRIYVIAKNKKLVVRYSGNGNKCISKVTLHQARLVLRRVTIHGTCNQQLSHLHSQKQGSAVTLSGWMEVKAHLTCGLVWWVTGKTV